MALSYTGIAQLLGVYVAFHHIAAILCAHLCEIGNHEQFYVPFGIWVP